MITTFNVLYKKPFENIMGKGENAGNQHFLLFPQYFLPYQKQNHYFRNILFVICKCFEFCQVQNIFVYFMLSGRISRNISENIFRSYTGSTSENTNFHVVVA